MKGPNVTDYRNARYITADERCVDMEVNTDLYGWLPITIHLDDDDMQEHIVQTKQWLVDNAASVSAYTPPVPPSLDELKADKRLEIESARDAGRFNKEATVTTPDGFTWQADPDSIGELNNAMTLFQSLGYVPAGYTWRDIYNVNHQADMALLTSIAAARADQVNAIWVTSWALKALVDDATTQAELDAIVVPAML